MRLRDLTNKRLDLGISVDCVSEQSAGCTGAVNLLLGYRTNGDCGIIHADLTVQGRAVPQTSPGGWRGCSSSVDCERSCKEPIWDGDITPVLDQIAENATIEISDGETSLQFIVGQPTTIATIQPRGLAPGDTLHDYDMLIADLVPVSAMTPQEFQRDASGQVERYLELRLDQNGRVFAPASGVGLEPKEGPWAFSAMLFWPGYDPKPAPGEVTLYFSLNTNQLPFSSCPEDTTCVGRAWRHMLGFPILYQP